MRGVESGAATCSGQVGEGAGVDEGVEVGGDLAGEVGVVEEEAGLDVALLAGLGEVGGGEEDSAAVDEDELGVLDGAGGGIGMEGAGVVEELGEEVAGPEVAAEAVEEAGAEFVLRAAMVAGAAFDVDDEADREAREVAHAFGDGAPEVAGAGAGVGVAGAVEGEVGDEDGGGGLAAEVADDDGGVARADAVDVGAAPDQLGAIEEGLTGATLVGEGADEERGLGRGHALGEEAGEIGVDGWREVGRELAGEARRGRGGADAAAFERRGEVVELRGCESGEEHERLRWWRRWRR